MSANARFRLLFLASISLVAQGQQAPQVQTPAAAPPVNVVENPGGRSVAGRGRGNSAAIAGDIDETPVVTHHSIAVDGKTLNYTATVAQMPIKNAAGETEAHIFYMAYTLDGVRESSTRPLTFCFNGGPGAASIWVHMGGMGPRSPQLMPDGAMPPPPYKLIDNRSTWLDKTDLVFIDPVGTGYSRAKNIEIARRMNGVEGDIRSVGEFIRMYIQRNARQASPLFVAGESYGTFRAARLAAYLFDRGIAFNGLVLIGTVLNFENAWSHPDDLVYELDFPTYAADAWYHKKVAPDLQAKSLPAFLKDAETFAIGDYAAALAGGDDLTPAERKAIIDKLVRFTGLEARYIDESNLRWDILHFTRQLLRDRRETIGRYDGRLVGPSSLNTGETSEYDPSGTLITPPFVAMFTSYVRNELNYKTDMYYYTEGGVQPWDYDDDNGYSDATAPLRMAMAKNPYMKVMVAAGYFDLATPYYLVKYTFNHMGLSPAMHKNMTWDFYQSGHMLYIDSDSRVKLKNDIADFYQRAIPQSLESETPEPGR